MKHYRAGALALALLAGHAGLAQAQTKAAGQPLNCDRGPLEKTFGGAPWLAYGCNDGRSLAIVSAPGSPAATFYFFVSPKANGYSISGEGTGKRNLTDAALKELRAMPVADMLALINEAKVLPKGR